jgi:hypothetical protein
MQEKVLKKFCKGISSKVRAIKLQQKYDPAQHLYIPYLDWTFPYLPLQLGPRAVTAHDTRK